MELEKREFQRSFSEMVQALHGRDIADTTAREQFLALVMVVREYTGRKWAAAVHPAASSQKQVWYFSIEFLPGRLLRGYLFNLGIYELCVQALAELGIAIAALEAEEEDAGTGSGGLGRLAACYLDSMAALGLGGHGCGLRYRYGLFEQRVCEGHQQELPDDWLKDGYYVWETRRPDEAVIIRYGTDEQVLAVPYDIPVTGYHNETVNTLRLWSSEEVPSQGCSATCQEAIAQKRRCQSITDSLYPDDSTSEGKTLRLKQQYLLVSAGLQSLIKNHLRHNSLELLPQRVAVHINDTHPALAIPELMRLLLDEYGWEWQQAWEVTTATISYTNHTILPEALETWPVDLFSSLLPRIYAIVHEINERFCRLLWQAYPGDWAKIAQMAVIADNQIKMAHLAIVGCYSINGVAKLHTDILKHQVMADFYHYTPEKFNNKTNGVTHRRWLMAANPGLAKLLSETIGTGWIERPERLEELLQFRSDAAFQEKLAAVKQLNKQRLASYICSKYGWKIDEHSLFDMQVKRIHAYKRQSMNALHIMDLYNRLRENPSLDIPARTYIFGGKAASGYYKAKKTIKLIHTLAQLINRDQTIQDKLKVVFLENYNVSLAELIIPAADISEQIPTASFEASGTANMKFMMNGAVTIGTQDGANVEIGSLVGTDNIITFGLSANDVLQYYRQGGYNPWSVYQSDHRVATVMEQLVNGFLPVPPDEFKTHYQSFLQEGDYYFVLKDFASYADAQQQAGELYHNRCRWLSMSAANIAHSGYFASDRTFAEYAAQIWQAVPGQNSAELYSGKTITQKKACSSSGEAYL